MTELMGHDLEDRARVERAESRQDEFNEELRAAQKEGNSDNERDKTEQTEPSSSNPIEMKIAPEQALEQTDQETDVALHVGKRKDEFGTFLNNIQVGMAIAVEERNDVSEV